MMKYRSSLEIRNMFLRFFKEKEHSVIESASLVPKNDDTLLWINSGVAALKGYFDGSVKPKNPRMVNIQKSLRTNDIENVGKTARHHTFFEMMGNFSIGDYFKEEAIDYAYEFLFSPEWLGFNVDDAYISVHPDDEEAFDFWTVKHNFPKERISKTADNFWQIGDGPCGPNSEIFIDRGEKYDPDNIGEKLFFEDLENDRYVEIWNIVFSQFDGKEGEDIHTFKELPQQNIDTGMGFERLVSLVQDGETNFDTDLFEPLIKELSTMTHITYKENPMAYRVVVDHIRTLVFAISDGALFSNEGRGYVLRRILRRAVRFGRQLGIEAMFMHKLVQTVVGTMSFIYPNLLGRQEMAEKLILAEEERFSKTLDAGEKLLIEAMDACENKTIDGETAFKLYDTYGFPVELSQEIAEEQDIKIDINGFHQEMEKQKERARQARRTESSMASQNEALMNFEEESMFNYENDSLFSVVSALFQEDKSVDELSGEGYIITKETPFYAESGGQVSDTGMILGESSNAVVKNVFKGPHGQHVHHVIVDGSIKCNEAVELKLDANRRLAIRKNHSAVHLLQSALKQSLGDHIEQAGSYVNDEYFRFDFSHFEALDKELLNDLELKINQWIANTLPVETLETDVQTARDMGAIALFGENYGDVVRLVKMGDESMELCGGTHVHNTAEIGVFKITSEESVGSGTRRINGTTSFHAYEVLKSYENTLSSMRKKHKVPVQKSLEDRFNEMADEIKTLEKEKASLLQEALKYELVDYLASAETNSSGLKVLWIEKENQDMKLLKELSDALVQKIDVIAIVNKKESSLNLMTRMSKEAITKGFKAGDIVKELAMITGGNGGGRPDFAQAGGKDLNKIAEAKASFYKKTMI